jgi:hypothetical protein
MAFIGTRTSLSCRRLRGVTVQGQALEERFENQDAAMTAFKAAHDWSRYNETQIDRLEARDLCPQGA